MSRYKKEGVVWVLTLIYLSEGGKPFTKYEYFYSPESASEYVPEFIKSILGLRITAIHIEPKKIMEVGSK